MDRNLGQKEYNEDTEALAKIAKSLFQQVFNDVFIILLPIGDKQICV